ncbi:MAG: autotransporter outer membrane beta-barrel domain-containing protein [Desulfobacteraceae bacterium]|nr:autotransporter outer membrane beta-barrel domain-containing protein [Desulfobacteraceae bacterium]
MNETQGGLLAYETLDYGDSDHLRHRLGARITGDHKISDTLEWQWAVTAAWQHEYMDNQISAHTSLAGVNRQFLTPVRQRDSLGLSISQGLNFHKGFGIVLGYEGELTQDFQGHHMTVTMDYKF